MDQSTISRQLKALRKQQKTGRWVPHKLSETNIANRLEYLCLSLFSEQQKSFLWKIVTGNEKWIYYVNPVNKKQWLSPDQDPLPTPKPDIHRKKVMLCVWWDEKGVVYYELLKPRQTVDASLYSQQLMRLSQELEKKRPIMSQLKRQVILLHDNARPHVAKTTQTTIKTLGWEVLSHPAYSPDIAP